MTESTDERMSCGYAQHGSPARCTCGTCESTDGNCPVCDDELQAGFGLAGGGYGAYMYCGACERVNSKTQDHS